ncbi:hypothetical protein BGZ76_005825 [Entomortierella beljakovae]|nr:hypothetical protein BGZ76_005825 [Entomortierella beljakovae]
MKPKQQLDIVIKCTNLEHLRWFSDVRSQDSTDIFCKEILNKTWPNLHQIEVSVRLDNIQLQQILSSLSRLTVLKVAHANWGSESFDALSGHFGTLEELLVQRSISFGSEMVNEVMSSCPKLHMLSAVLLEGVDIIGDDQISNNKSQRAWVCTQLTDLSVQIDMRPHWEKSRW